MNGFNLILRQNPPDWTTCLVPSLGWAEKNSPVKLDKAGQTNPGEFKIGKIVRHEPQCNILSQVGASEYEERGARKMIYFGFISKYMSRNGNMWTRNFKVSNFLKKSVVLLS